MLEPLAGFSDWSRDTWQDIEASRKASDDSEGKGAAVPMARS